MALNRNVLYVLSFKVFLSPFLMNASENYKYAEGTFSNFILVDQSCTSDPKFLEETIKNPYPKAIIRCFSSSSVQRISSQSIIEDIHDFQKKDREGPRQVGRYGHHRFTHVFYTIDNPQFLAFWKKIYGEITLTSHQIKFYQWALEKFTKYPHYDIATLIGDYWQSQWNQDIFLPQSPSTSSFLVTKLQENLGQLPTLFQQRLPPTNPTSLKEFPVLFYSPISGWGGYCPPKASTSKLLSELTNSFNAYDRLFCDAFNHLNVTFLISYNYGEFRWVRSFLLRDDLVSSFPPDPGALFYASPGITFVVLREHPILWSNVLRPFTPFLWGATIGTFSGILLFRGFLRYKVKVAASLTTAIISSLRMLDLAASFGQLIITMVYGGMVLIGLLHPEYSWSPSTFTELNKTKQFYGATSFSVAINPDRLIGTGVLNGVSLWKDREVERENKLTPGTYLDDDEQDQQHRYALIMDDDKKFLYIYGRSELRHTAKYIRRLQSASESVLQEMRYVSVAPSATKLQGVVETLRKLFESGGWLRWKYLEDNYYKTVAPYLVNQKLNHTEETNDITSLQLVHVSTVFIFLGASVIFSSICCLTEAIISHSRHSKYKSRTNAGLIMVSSTSPSSNFN